MKSRITFVFIALAISAVFGFGCSDNSVNSIHTTDHVASEPFEYSFDSAAHLGINLDGINGNVQISSESGLNSVEISGLRRVGSDSDADAEEYLRLLTVTVSDSGECIQITVDQPSDTEWRSVTVDFDILVPTDYELEINIVNGNVTLDSLNADVQISTVNGNIIFDRINGQCDMQVVNGQISGMMLLPPQGGSAFSVVNGLLNLTIPRTTSADFGASVVNGGISINELVFHDYYETPTSFSGTLGSGDGTIALSAVNGNISVTGY